MKPKIDWRPHLKPEEKRIIERADKARAAWRALALQRAKAISRAIQRARYASSRP